MVANRFLQADQRVPYSYIDVRVTQCPDMSICCGEANITCCAKGEGVWIKDGDATRVNPFAVNSSYSTIITTRSRSIHPTSNSMSPTCLTPTSDPLQLTTTSLPQSELNQSSGQIVGVSFGSACVIMILIVGLIWYF